MSKRGWIITLTVALAISSVGFYLFPRLDLAASRLFWNGGHFPLAKGQPAAFVSDWLHYGLDAVFLIFAMVTPVVLWRRKAASPAWRKYLFIVLAVVLAAGLVTNLILKDHWGRARPNQIVQFGGTAAFTRAWVVSDQCFRNCSFVGGDVSLAFCALAPALLARRRRRWIPSAVALGCVTAAMRMAAGAHFLSDCVISALLTSLIVLGLEWAMKPTATG